MTEPAFSPYLSDLKLEKTVKREVTQLSLPPASTLWAPGFGLPGLTVSKVVYWAQATCPDLPRPLSIYMSFYLMSTL